MKIGITGTGGVGGYFGGKIAKAGYNVTFVSGEKNLEALQKNGLIVKSILGDFKIDKVNAKENISFAINTDICIL